MLIHMKNWVSQWRLLCANTIIPRHSFCKGLQLVLKQLEIFLKKKAIAYSSYPWYAKEQYFATSKTKETNRCRWALGTTMGLPGPGRGFSWHSPSICPTAAGPSAAHMQLARELRLNSPDPAQRRYLVINWWQAAVLFLLILISVISFFWENLSSGIMWNGSQVDCPRAQELHLSPGTPTPTLTPFIVKIHPDK